jgi:SanA protein
MNYLEKIKGYPRLLRIFKRVIIGLAIIALSMVTFFIYSNLTVYLNGSKDLYFYDQAPKSEVAIVLGAKVFQNGHLSAILGDRVKTGIELYQQGKVKKLLMSGDHGQESYDEVNAMAKFAIDHGIPEEDVFMDHAGFSTYDSMYRASDVFEVKSAIIVTQEFHLPRAVYLAKAMGIEAVGVYADKQKYNNEGYLYRRELLARIKAVGELMLGGKPKYLGPVIPITGDGKVTRD